MFNMTEPIWAADFARAAMVMQLSCTRIPNVKPWADRADKTLGTETELF